MKFDYVKKKLALDTRRPHLAKPKFDLHRTAEIVFETTLCVWCVLLSYTNSVRSVPNIHCSHRVSSYENIPSKRALEK